MNLDKLPIVYSDQQRDLIVPGDADTTVRFCVEHFIATCHRALKHHDNFYVALSGGSTPKAIFTHLSNPAYAAQVDWKRVHLFWSDERSVPPDHPDSNYRMAMDAGLAKVSLLPPHIHRMCAEDNIAQNALEYEQTIQKTLKGRPFDLVMLGMGDDGHTASLFPGTQALEIKSRLVTENYIPEKKTWRMTLTFECINQAGHTAIYVLGVAKQTRLVDIFFPSTPDENLPAMRVGTPECHALWIADRDAAKLLLSHTPALTPRQGQQSCAKENT